MAEQNYQIRFDLDEISMIRRLIRAEMDRVQAAHLRALQESGDTSQTEADGEVLARLNQRL